jgi:fatty acid desaturase
MFLPWNMSIAAPQNTAVRPTKSRTQEQYSRDYAALLATMADLGLMKRRYGWYLARAAILLGALALGIAALFAFAPGPWLLLLAVGFGVLFTQMALLGHDAAHRQIFASGKGNEWAARIIANLFVGLSYGWWMNKHGKHHANPNKMGKDGDIDPGALVFTADDAREIAGRRAWWMARQHWFFFPLLTVAGLDLHINAVKAVLGKERIKHARLEATLLAVRLLGFPVLVALAVGPWWALAFMAVQLAVFGVYMGGSFAPNHKGMPIVPKTVNIDFLRRQTLMSRNIDGGLPVAVLMGGLNYQIEHHLFPTMPSVNLRRARPIVREYCATHDVKYTETTLLGSYRIVLQYLKKVGLKHADPFECPVTMEFRTR